MVGFAMVMRGVLNPYSKRLIDCLYMSGMRCSITPDCLMFNIHGRPVNINRISYKSWELYYMSHTYKFYNQSEMIEWIEDQRRHGK